MKRNIALILVLAVFALFCFGVQDGLTQSNPKQGGMVTVGLNTDILGLDPHSTSAVVNAIVWSHVFEPLVGYGENMEYVPVLAERWEISPDFKTYTFYLLKGKLFHNGREMVAEDVKYSIERMMDPKIGCPRRKGLKNVDRIEAVDKYTVRVHMKKTDSRLISVLAYTQPVMAVLPQEEVVKQGGVITHPVGTGPFKFVEWKPDRYVLLERFDQYKPQTGPRNFVGGERIAYVDRVKFVPVPEESVATMALLNKEIDLLQFLPYKNVEKFRKDYSKRGIVVREKSGQNWYGLWFSLKKPITKNLKFRQACAYATDREIIMKAATRGHGVLNPSVTGSQNQYYTPFHKKWYKKDVGKAKQLLKEAGYKGEEVVIDCTKKYPMMYSQAVAFQAELAAVGINTKLNVVDWPVMMKKFYSGDFQIYSVGVGVRPDPALGYASVAPTGIEEKYPRVKEIRAEAENTRDFETLKKLFEEAHGIYYEAVPIIMCYHYNLLHAHWDYLKSYEMTWTGFPRLWGVWLDK